MTYLHQARQVFDIEIAALEAVRDRLDPAAFEAAVGMLVTALHNRNKIVVIGIGKSGNVGQKMVATLTSTGSTAVLLNSVDALHGDLGIVQDGDVILTLSYSGESEELLQLLPALKRFDVRILALTGERESTLAKFSDVILDVQVPQEACPLNLAPTSSTSAMMVLGDALAMTVLNARGFTKKDFARHHPSGAIGRALLLRLRDIMRTGRRNPVAHQGVSVREALVVMTQAKAGSVSVTDDSGRLVGVFTDGDLRRLLGVSHGDLNDSLDCVMNPKPISLDQNALAVDALRIFNQQNIDDLVVVDDAFHPVGLVDLQDLPKLKLV